MHRLGKCCGTCLWCYTTEELEDYVLEEDELNIPQVGDCALGVKELEDKYECSLYSPIKGANRAIIIYDEEYMGPGYFIISSNEDKIYKFVKLYAVNNNGFPVYYVRAYDCDLFQEHDDFKEIIMPLGKLELNKFNGLMFHDVVHKGNNYFKLELSEEYFRMVLFSELKHNESNFIDIELGDIHSCHNYDELIYLYQYLSKNAICKNDIVSKILKLK